MPSHAEEYSLVFVSRLRCICNRPAAQTLYLALTYNHHVHDINRSRLSIRMKREEHSSISVASGNISISSKKITLSTEIKNISKLNSAFMWLSLPRRDRALCYSQTSPGLICTFDKAPPPAPCKAGSKILSIFWRISFLFDEFLTDFVCELKIVKHHGAPIFP